MLPQVDALGRVFTAPAGVPVSWNAGLGYAANGALCTTQVLGPNDQYIGGWRLDPLGRVVVAALGGGPIFFNGGIPFNANGSLVGQPNVVPIATDPYVRGIRVGAAGVYGVNAAPPLDFLEEMSIGHELNVGINPAGTRVGYRRGEWGDFLPDDVASLQRLFTNLNNNRLVVQATGNKSTLVISNIHIERLSPLQVFDFGPPNSVIYDGVQTDFTWIVPGFDFVLGENYEVSLS
jgi:hypothetical protein